MKPNRCTHHFAPARTSVLTLVLIGLLPAGSLWAGDVTTFVSPCQPLPADRTPHDGLDNDDGWSIVDFCTAGATGAGPAVVPDCHHNDDDSADFSLGFTFSFYGSDYTDAFINNNGNLTFGSLFGAFTATGFPDVGPMMIAPFWADVDTGTPGVSSDLELLGHVWQKSVSANTVAVTWDQVGYFNDASDKLNTFQVLLSDGLNEDMGVGNNVCFCYADMQWTTGDASGGTAGFGGTPATAGANRGDGTDFFQIGRFDHAGADYDGPDGAVDGVDFLDGKGAGVAAPFCFNTSGSNIPPIAVGFPTDDELRVGCDEVIELDLDFLSPEGNQTTNVVVNDPDGAQAAGLVITITPGNPATVELDWAVDPTDEGTYVLTFTATDDFDPAGETERTLTIVVDCSDDEDGDGVSDALDVCPGTEIPERVPTRWLKHRRWALVDDDTVFDTSYAYELTIEDTAGCSCDQILHGLTSWAGIEAQETLWLLSQVKYGCRTWTMRKWLWLLAHDPS